MAASNYLHYEQGTAIAWKSSGGDYALTCTSVTNGNARQGAKGDLQKNSSTSSRACVRRAFHVLGRLCGDGRERDRALVGAV